MKTVDKYLQLLQTFPPRPITSAIGLEATQAMINQLLDKSELSPDEEDYLEVLGSLVYDYEQAQEEIIPDIYGIELLKVLMAERELKQKDLVFIFESESIVSDVLNEKCQLTVGHIQKLADFFNLSPAVFFPVKSS
ncbi:MAG: transcriptional regulator [Snowella sp.]|nr:transcriptional regulator [Snowella sp.]